AKVVVREIDRIDALVARLRGLTPTVQRMIALDVAVPIQETLALLRAQLEQARIVATTSLQSPLPLVAGNVDHLKQLFLNVFVNAIEAMSSGGRIEIRLLAQRALGSEVVIADVDDPRP